MFRTPWIATRAVVLVVPRRAEGEFRQMECGHVYCAGPVEPVENGCRGVGDEIPPDFRAARHDLAGPVEQVLLRQRYAVQRPPQVSPPALAIEAFRRAQGLCAVDGDRAIQLCANAFQPLERSLRQLQGRDAPVLERFGGLGQRQRPQGLIAHLASSRRTRTQCAGSSSKRIRSSAESLTVALSWLTSGPYAASES